ncbi:MAG: PIN domain-containing protein [Deltaproteobacteria bacterium]|nr:PIN domain-containing protein [Deltaproteobacteria bacterium]
MTPALLDVNVLIALLDRDHTRHRAARAWLEREVRHGWASCPLTQNGCIRIMSQPGYPNPLPVSQVMERLGKATQTRHHQFWPDDISLLDEAVFDRSRVEGPRQLTDLYLLALAAQHGSRFATFDGRIPLAAVTAAGPEHITVVS